MLQWPLGGLWPVALSQSVSQSVRPDDVSFSVCANCSNVLFGLTCPGRVCFCVCVHEQSCARVCACLRKKPFHSVCPDPALRIDVAVVFRRLSCPRGQVLFVYVNSAISVCADRAKAARAAEGFAFHRNAPNKAAASPLRFGLPLNARRLRHIDDVYPKQIHALGHTTIADKCMING